ncbi:MAG: hypothetical protein H0V51_02685 [Chloroflexi bacterium]|nr:hypothetical protein [Chloroflexota bacterium]
MPAWSRISKDSDTTSRGSLESTREDFWRRSRHRPLDWSNLNEIGTLARGLGWTGA